MNMKEKLADPILITGAARSGTSLVAGVINMCGAFGGEMRGPNPNNPKGMFENVKIIQDIVKPYLRRLKVDPLGQFPLPQVGQLSIPINWRNQIERAIIEDGYTDGPWMYKGAKMCLMWPVWNYAFPNAKWIIVRRRTGDIVESCIKTNFMRAFNMESNQRAVHAQGEKEGWIWWVNQHEKRFVEMIEAGLNVKIVWPQRMVNGDYTQIYDTMDWLGLEWKSEVLSHIDPKLWKARRK